ncbi:hypothetical protein BOTBODRAFT_66969 [Botryobasidium botryosum FD-172 SS1]|uniref:Uncharacterized protein n=1 Tax=Botryobasidium botryosum (strain FD-172 SS1) TaxID=930990 RepID=A0A067MN07_BOTB1|nr:hypothetical protein BOTBODRAFT_66969 [Botryobasidium botryosum FD-172 SS1]
MLGRPLPPSYAKFTPIDAQILSAAMPSSREALKQRNRGPIPPKVQRFFKEKEVAREISSGERFLLCLKIVLGYMFDKGKVIFGFAITVCTKIIYTTIIVLWWAAPVVMPITRQLVVFLFVVATGIYGLMTAKAVDHKEQSVRPVCIKKAGTRVRFDLSPSLVSSNADAGSRGLQEVTRIPVSPRHRSKHHFQQTRAFQNLKDYAYIDKNPRSEREKMVWSIDIEEREKYVSAVSGRWYS